MVVAKTATNLCVNNEGAIAPKYDFSTGIKIDHMNPAEASVFTLLEMDL